MATLTTVTSLLKEAYGVAIQESLNNEVMLKKWIEASSRPYDGLRVNYPVHTSRNVSVAARAEGGLLATAGAQGYESVYVTAGYVYGTFNVTGPSLKAAGKNAFATTLSREMEGLKTDLAFELGRMSYGEGLGILAQCQASASEGGAGAGASQTVYNQYAEPGQPGGRYIKAGQIIQHGTIGTMSASSFGVSSVQLAANSGTTVDYINVTASSLSTSGTNAFLSVKNGGGRGLEIKGLRAFVDDSTATHVYGYSGGMFGDKDIFNVDRNATLGWNAVVDGNSGVERIIDSYLVQRNQSAIKRKGGKNIDIMFGEYEVVDAYLDSLRADRRYAGGAGPIGFDGGADEISHNGKVMVKDLQAPYNELFLLNRDAVKWYPLQEVEFAADDGDVLKNVSGYDKFEGFVRCYTQIAPGEYAAPNCTGVIRDIKTRLA
jgi:hypothetical protein